jgi:tRNA-dihydrouridine synthase
MNNFWQKTKKPIKILAPMAGYTDSAFRILCRQYGADITMTELISADAIFHTAKNWYKDEKGEWQSKKYSKESGKIDETLQMLKFDDRERPLVIQLFGKYPEKFAFASDWITKNLKPDGIDINMGCPARKVVNSDHGAALLKNPALAVEIVHAVKANTNLPVSVKTRLGWDNDAQILEFAPELLRAGISAIMIHGRTYKDGFKGKARWENIYEVKKLLGDELIVIGNGDITSNLNFKIQNLKTNEKCEMINDKYSLDGFAIGRATIGKPWVFSKEEIGIDELKQLILAHARLEYEKKGEFGLVEFRKHLLLYLRDFSGAKKMRIKAVAIQTIEDIELILDEIER